MKKKSTTKKPWSISTTVRNPERLRNFLRVLKQLEGQPFDKGNQIKYQILLIQERLYLPKIIPDKYKYYYQNINIEMPYEIAEEIFNLQNYEDPPMRGRQSVNPLNKLGFSIAREREGLIRITELGNKFLADTYEIDYIFFKSLLKLQFPNPWSGGDFSEKEGFDIMPFVATMRLIYNLNKKSQKKGLDKEEFSIFIPTLITYKLIETYVEKILEFRNRKNKEKIDFILEFLRNFYGRNDLTLNDKKVKNLFDYGDNTMRYFRLTKFFKIKTDDYGFSWNIDLEPSRMIEIEILLKNFEGKALNFKTKEDYLTYLIDIERPLLPFEEITSLKEISKNLRETIKSFISNENITIEKEEKDFLEGPEPNSKTSLIDYIKSLRELNLKFIEKVKREKFRSDINKIKNLIEILKDRKRIIKIEPEQFEKIIVEVLMIINDEKLIKPNYH